jgi:hypothetical protein
LATHETRGGGAESPGGICDTTGIRWNDVEFVGKPDEQCISITHLSFIAGLILITKVEC